MRVAMRLFPLVPGLALALAGCGDEAFTVHRTPEFPRSGASVSVLGVYRDGRMSPESWDLLRHRLTPIVGPGGCEPGYPEAVASSSPALAQAVDDYTRANGVTEDVMAELAPMARGDLILLVMMTGRPHGPADKAPSTTPTQPAAVRPGGRRGYQGTSAPSHVPGGEPDAFEVMASIFSVRSHHTVGALNMRYSGASLDEALDAFSARLAQELPSASCAGWNPTVRVDAAKIRKLETE